MIEEFNPNDPETFIEIPMTVNQIVPKHKLSPQEAAIRTLKIFGPVGVGIILILFGLTSYGSFYLPTSKFGGVLADIFYGWQFGNLLAMVGVVLIYDAVKRTGYL